MGYDYVLFAMVLALCFMYVYQLLLFNFLFRERDRRITSLDCSFRTQVLLSRCEEWAELTDASLIDIAVGMTNAKCCNAGLQSCSHKTTARQQEVEQGKPI
jgi:hypothetical protein